MTITTPLRCSFSNMTQRGSNEVVLLNTGSYPSFSNYLNETYTWNGTNWVLVSTTQIDPNGPLPARTQSAMAYDGTSVMLFGGKGKTTVHNDTWLWNGTTWTQQTVGFAPFARWGAEAAYLSGTGVVMFGGAGGAGSGSNLNETWVWNETTQWTQITPVVNPIARTQHCMAAGSSSVVMFGGVISSGEFRNDTWTYNSTTQWTQVNAPNAPSVRGGASMVYDSHNSNWVLFGGMNEYNYLPETWIFNGSNWVQQFPAVSPPGLVGAQMCYDSQSTSVIMFGGNSASSNYPSNQTWQWKNQGWNLL